MPAVNAAALAPDHALPTMSMALDPTRATPAVVASLGVPATESRICAIDVLAYKPGRRCVIEYRLDTVSERGHHIQIAVLGKIRAKRFGNSGYRQLRAIWDAGFDNLSADGVSVPEPLGTVPALRMWLQRKVDGIVATALLEPERVSLAERIAAAAHKLHSAPLTPDRRHTIDHELQILERCLVDTASRFPWMATPIAKLLDRAIRLGVLLPSPPWCPSHRDFYADQLIVSGGRMFLIDFDLFCEADPGLDIGNFIGHVTEQAVRVHGSPDALGSLERELEEQFVRHAGEQVRWPVRVYAALTLLRHVYLCTRTAERAPFLETLVTVARERIGRTAAEGGHA